MKKYMITITICGLLSSHILAYDNSDVNQANDLQSITNKSQNINDRLEELMKRNKSNEELKIFKQWLQIANESKGEFVTLTSYWLGFNVVEVLKFHISNADYSIVEEMYYKLISQSETVDRNEFASLGYTHTLNTDLNVRALPIATDITKRYILPKGSFVKCVYDLEINDSTWCYIIDEKHNEGWINKKFTFGLASNDN